MADYDGIEEEYDNYEDQYADELDELANFDEEEVNFNTVLKSKAIIRTQVQEDSLKLDTNNTIQITAAREISSQKHNAPGKRTCSEIDIDFFKENIEDENIFPNKGGGLKPKKLKLDELDLDDSLKHISSINIKNINTSKVIEQLQNVHEEDSFDEVSYNISRQRVFSRPVFGVDTLNVTNTDGDRVFLKLCTEDELPSIEDKRWLSNSSEKGLNLLSVPFDQLKNEVQERRHARIVKEANVIQASDENTNENELKDKKSGDLWVDKYSPKEYTDLLSDDGTNRFVLKWLKLWDGVVFGVEDVKPKEKSDEQETGGGGMFPKNQTDGKTNFQTFKKFYNPEDDLVKDSKGRPKKKVALLCGNPGLGKTTLAHVISNHAGYNVVEMNASDDRSPEVFLNKIETSTQMKAVIGQTKRPNCLVIDEIDGAPIQAINILLELIKTTDTGGGKGGGKGGKGKKKRKKKEFYLNRPIICICNDQFVPALRQLRQVAFTLKFPATIPSRLAGRLLNISLKESLRIDMGTLLMLADKAENDIRSCLNTLQFIKQKKDFKTDDLKTLDIGQKDMKKGFRAILTEVFQLPKKKKLIGQFSESKASASNRFHYMLHLVSGNSEFDKIQQGLFDEYLNCKTKDPYLESINLANDWLGFTDIVQQKVSHDQDYVMWKFLSFLPVAFHMFFARASPGKVQYCNDSYENHLKRTHNLQTMQLMVNGMSPNLRRCSSSGILILDLIPYIFFILTPSLRPVNTKLYSTSEKQMFLSLINTLISYNLTYRQERNLEGQYTYVLEPNIEELVLYSGLPQHRQLLYATKQLIGREVELEKLRHAEGIMKQGEVNEVPIASSADQTARPVVPEQALKPRNIRFADRPQVDFFGRVIQPSVKKAKKTVNSEESKKIASVMNTATWFRFNEGYTNAVRRTIKLPEFL